MSDNKRTWVFLSDLPETVLKHLLTGNLPWPHYTRCRSPQKSDCQELPVHHLPPPPAGGGQGQGEITGLHARQHW